MIIKGLIYNPSKIFVSQNKANIKVIGDETNEYLFRIGRGWHNFEILDLKKRVVVYSKIDAKSFWKKFIMDGPIVFYRNEKEILRYVNSSLIILPDGSQIDYDYRKYTFERGGNRINFTKNRREIEFECNQNFLFETIIISIKSFWCPKHESN